MGCLNLSGSHSTCISEEVKDMINFSSYRSTIRNDYTSHVRSYTSRPNRTSSAAKPNQEYVIYVPNGGVGPAPVIKLKRVTEQTYQPSKSYQIKGSKTYVPPKKSHIIRYPTGGIRYPNNNNNNNHNGRGHGHVTYPGGANNGNNNNNGHGPQDDINRFTTRRPWPVFTRPPVTTPSPPRTREPITARTTTPTTTTTTTTTAATTTPPHPATTFKLPKTTTGYGGPIYNNNNNNVNINILPHPTNGPLTGAGDRNDEGSKFTHKVPIITSTTPRMYDDLIGANGRDGHDGKQDDNGNLIGGGDRDPRKSQVLKQVLFERNLCTINSLWPTYYSLAVDTLLLTHLSQESGVDKSCPESVDKCVRLPPISM